MRGKLFLGTAAIMGLCVTVAQAGETVIVGGNQRANLVRALTDLGVDFTEVNGDPDPNSGDILFIGRDGGQALAHDYTNFLNDGGAVILAGGSSLSVYCNDISSKYFNTDGSCSWHTDGAWTSVNDHPANEGLPSPYTFANSSHTFHMLHFTDDTPNTIIYGINDEENNVAAFRTFDNGGSFNYMALDLAFRPSDEDEFITPWVEAALNAATGAGTSCTYTVKKSKAKKGCEECPAKGDDFSTEEACESVKDCKKKVKTKIACPDGNGTCKIKAKRSSCG